MRILANDGIDKNGEILLRNAGFLVDTQHIPQQELNGRIKDYDAILVRSATQVREDLIDAAPHLRLIGRGGVGMDNIAVEYARSKGVEVINTPSASSLSVAELVFAHLLSGVRFLYDSQRKMPVEGHSQFSTLKKAYAQGTELRGKTLGIVGFGRIGREVARIGLGLGMNVVVSDPYDVPKHMTLHLSGGVSVDVPVRKLSLQDLYSESDFISFHVPYLDKPLLDVLDFPYLKDGVGLINTARGGIIHEEALISALDNGKVAFAGLDVFEGEPRPRKALLTHPRISLSPHIGAATQEAQGRIGEELAQTIIEFFKKQPVM